jgi:transcriptional antiterminator NusG
MSDDNTLETPEEVAEETMTDVTTSDEAVAEEEASIAETIPAEEPAPTSDSLPSVDDMEDEESDEPGSWYVVHTQSGFEMKATEALKQRIKSLGFEEKIFDIIVPRRDVVSVKGGKKRKTKEKVFPGYILVRMILDNDSWLVVRTTQGITGFVGAGTKPTPISEKEVKAIMRFVKQDQPRFKAKFSVNEAVKITDGPFSDFVGTINQMDEEKGKVTVLVNIFGRETPVELDFLQISKL